MGISFSYAFIVIAVIVVIVLGKTATVVPQQSAFVIENLGKYSRTLQAGFHILIPFVEKVAYRHSLKEIAIDIAEQICITRDNVQVGVDAVLYMQVMDPHLASYGITNFGFAISQLAQTTLRSEIGKIELDRTFEARGQINTNVVSELDKASAPWGVKVLRYEIKNITPPRDVLQAMEKQMRAEREKRAVVLTSEGERDAKINAAEGDKQRVIKQSEANKQQQINEAEGQAQAILAVATATAEGLRQVGIALALGQPCACLFALCGAIKNGAQLRLGKILQIEKMVHISSLFPTRYKRVPICLQLRLHRHRLRLVAAASAPHCRQPR